jgi:hypothetical protein
MTSPKTHRTRIWPAAIATVLVLATLAAIPASVAAFTTRNLDLGFTVWQASVITIMVGVLAEHIYNRPRP